MKVQHIQTLVAIAEAGSIRRAAKWLGKSQPALSKSLRRIENNPDISRPNP
ncbi:MAG: LysR family transcriptional regulator [Pseudomonadota bacterium]